MRPNAGTGSGRAASARAALAALALAALASGLAASSAPSEDEGAMFGGAAAEPAAAAAPAAAKAGAATALSPAAGSGSAIDNSDSGGLNTGNLGHDDFANGTVKEDPLQVGGTIYQQGFADFGRNVGPGQAALSLPLQLDTFLDMRPNERLRGYVDARMIYDPSRDGSDSSTSGATNTYLTAGSSAPEGGSAAGTTATATNPSVVLDQAWFKFDVDQVAFLTVGKQHMKWGTGHIWNPTDFLTTQTYNPLQPYDLRLGNSMVKVQVPIEKVTGTNLYAVALLDNPEPASTLQQVGGAFRAETLVFGAEVGVDAVTRADRFPDYGADISTQVGPLDFYAETALLSGDGYYREYVYKGFAPGAPLASAYGVNLLPGPIDQSVAGLSWDFGWTENRQATLGAEYFYNELGVSSAQLLPVLIYLGQYQGFYEGKQYAALYLSAEGPDEGKKTNYNLSNIVNISDGSAVSRLDFTWLLQDYLTFGAWASVHYGTQGGELNFALNTPPVGPMVRNQAGQQVPTIPAVNVEAGPLELGLSLRLAY